LTPKRVAGLGLGFAIACPSAFRGSRRLPELIPKLIQEAMARMIWVVDIVDHGLPALRAEWRIERHRRLNLVHQRRQNIDGRSQPSGGVALLLAAVSE
jgi:hypothetical protein